MIDYRITLFNTHFGHLTLTDEDEPIGLADLEFTMRRHDQFHGVFPEISLGLKWICAGKKFITNAYEIDGIDALIQILIEGKPRGKYFQQLYAGKLDLSTAKWTYDFVECEIKPDNCLDIFMNRLDNKVNLYDEPCFTEYTMDKTAYRTRYAYCPYQPEMHEMPIVGISRIAAADNAVSVFSDGCVHGPPAFPMTCASGDELQCGNLMPSVFDDLEITEVDGCRTVFKPTCPDTYNVCLSYYVVIDSRITWVNNSGDAAWDVLFAYKKGTSPSVPIVGANLGEFEVFGVPDGSVEKVYCASFNVCFDVVITQTDIDTNENEIHLEAFWAITQNPNSADFTNPGSSIVVASLTWREFSFTLTSKNCIPHLARVGTTRPNMYMVHESFSRLAEHYTNNCLRVKSNFFGRPNSMQWANDCVTQNPTCAVVGEVDPCNPAPPYPYEPAPEPCDCNNPTGFPDCVDTFSPTPYQVTPAGCGAYTVLTSGVSLRGFGTQFFLSFQELFDAMNAIWCIGVGYTDLEPTTLRVEDINYFYQDVAILDLGEVDLYNSKWQQGVATEMYFSRYEGGYSEWLQDEINTIDTVHTSREYTIKNKNVDNNLSAICNFIADGYAIEWQRRQIYSVDSQFDESTFVVCVGRSVDNTNTLAINGNPPIPYHMWVTEQGVESPSGFFSPDEYYNWRIRPRANALRWREWLSTGLWHKDATDSIDFAKGEANFTACGADVNIADGCGYGLACENDDILKDNTPFMFPEEITVNVPISINQYNTVRDNPYGVIIMNNEKFFLKELRFKPNANSTLTLMRANYD